MGDRCIEVQLGSKRFKDGAYAYTLLGGETVPVIVRVIAHVGLQGFPTIVLRHWFPFMCLRRVTGKGQRGDSNAPRRSHQLQRRKLTRQLGQRWCRSDDVGPDVSCLRPTVPSAIAVGSGTLSEKMRRVRFQDFRQISGARVDE